jgi:hypothetical protein
LDLKEYKVRKARLAIPARRGRKVHRGRKAIPAVLLDRKASKGRRVRRATKAMAARKVRRAR